MHRLYRATSLALALSLAAAGSAFAGASAGAVITQSGATTVAGVGPGESVSIVVEASGLVNAKRVTIAVQLSDPAAFETSNQITMQAAGVASGWLASPFGILAQGSTDTYELGAAGLSGSGANGDATFTVNLVTSSSFSADTEATVTVTKVEFVDTDNAADTFAPGFGLQLNPPVSDPTLVATSDSDISADFSAVGSGNAADGSAGEVSLGVLFSDATGAAAAGQTITWTIINNGAESIYVLGSSVTEIAVGSDVTMTTTSGADGTSGLMLDAEGDFQAGSTTASISATTSADNSEGTSLDLSADFSVTWDVAVPAELASFAADVTVDQNVRLSWSVASQTNNLGWQVFRSVDNVSFERVGDLVQGDGTVNAVREYNFLDDSTPASDVVYYYLRQVDLNGSSSRSQVIEVSLAPTAVDEQSLPLVTALDQNYPNPFNPETTIQFDLASSTSVSLRVYDTAGQVVRTLIRAELPAGSYTQVWNGRNALGAKVGSGVYFYELRAGSFTSMKKMTLLQ
jgi:hypothetical protein